MALSNHQIERYSRQLIVPEFGGIVQERLLAARLLLIGNLTETLVLAYLVGAGVGHIDLDADPAPETIAGLLTRMRDLNPDSTVGIRPRLPPDKALDEFALILALVDDPSTLERARALFDRRTSFAGNPGVVLARLDLPGSIAVIPCRPPCPRCAGGGDLLVPFCNLPAANAGFVASLAALEAIKLLAGVMLPPNPTLIEFRGYEVTARVIESTLSSNCNCTAPMTD